MRNDMAYVITEACIGEMDHACIDVCPVDCIYEAEPHLVIDPQECVSCGACVSVCPVEAIYMAIDIPAHLEKYIDDNERMTREHNLPIAQRRSDWQRDRHIPGTRAHDYYQKWCKINPAENNSLLQK
jgi:ferredoxin